MVRGASPATSQTGPMAPSSRETPPSATVADTAWRERRPPQAVLAWCPMCDGRLEPEHAHYRCASCGWRDSCCD
jgi:hypothetical protein